MTQSVDEKFKAFAVKHNFVHRIDGAESHWYFIEGAQAFESGLYIASTLSFLNGIESSIRAILMYLDQGFENTDLTGSVLSNGLLTRAQNVGLDVGLLAFQNEADFTEKLGNKRTPVELVRHRNNLCHGNVFEYIQEVPETGERIFIPEFLAPVASEIRDLSEKWSKEVARFKSEWPED
jgi:hypothetical protein